MPNLARPLKHALLFTLILTSSGCALRPTTTPDTKVQWQAHQQQVSQLDTWQLQGKIGIRTADDAGSAYLNWEQHGDQYRITLSGPLGQGATRISGTRYQAQLESGDDIFTAPSPELLLWQHTGWLIPLDHLLSWIKGIPDAASDATLQWNEFGALASLEQAGWSLNFDRYADSLGELLPHRITLNKDDLSVKVIIKSWQLPDAP